VPFWASKFYNRYFPLYANEATRIATVSEYSKNDIATNYKIDPNKIDVVYNGINESFTTVDEATKLAARKEVAEGKQYFVFVGSLHPRKNIKRLLLAFEKFKEESNSDFKLVSSRFSLLGNERIKGNNGCNEACKRCCFYWSFK
jgi:glycosyltransferase involved in cell wall biosynthesis